MCFFHSYSSKVPFNYCFLHVIFGEDMPCSHNLKISYFMLFHCCYLRLITSSFFCYLIVLISGLYVWSLAILYESHILYQRHALKCLIVLALQFCRCSSFSRCVIDCGSALVALFWYLVCLFIIHVFFCFETSLGMALNVSGQWVQSISLSRENAQDKDDWT